MKTKARFLIFIPILFIVPVNFEKSPSKKYGIKDIFCEGPLLHTVQMEKIFPDSKTFVDMKLKSSPTETLEKFRIFMDVHDHKPSKKDIKDFVNNNFEPNNQEFMKWMPKDWTPKPKFLEKIRDGELRYFGSSLNSIWKDLGRQIKLDVRDNSDLYSLIYVPHPFIVPGGRFREFYYWDSYWIMEGLLLSEMKSTVKGMLENFIYIVEKFGHIPNGGRIYYLERSQPPFFIPMVKNYLEASDDFEFLEKNLKTFDKEFKYWMENHMKTFEYHGKNYSMAVYGDNSEGPRPESYSEDVETARIFKNKHDKNAFYSELKAAAESGWDFSSRWFISNDLQSNLTHTKTKSIVPVDLNALLYWNAIILRDFHKILGTNQVFYYQKKSQEFLQSIQEVLWDDEAGSWFDFDLINSIKRKNFYPSNLVPLFTNSYPEENKSEIIDKVLNYLRENEIRNFDGGVPTSLEQTGEQWDFPNAWPPLQHMIIVGLHQSGDNRAKAFAYRLAEKWVLSNFQSFKETGAMFEKYDAVSFGGHGSGGEYDVQLGFGWSNGVIMSLLDMYGKHLKTQHHFFTKYGVVLLEEQEKEIFYKGSSNSIFAQTRTAVVCLLISLIFGFIG